jgi:hypothetical protein
MRTKGLVSRYHLNSPGVDPVHLALDKSHCWLIDQGYAVSGLPVPVYSDITLSSAPKPGDVRKQTTAAAHSLRPILLCQCSAFLLLPEEWYSIVLDIISKEIRFVNSLIND